MNDLLGDSFEIPRGQSSSRGDVELGVQLNSGELGLENFFKKLEGIDKEYANLEKQ